MSEEEFTLKEYDAHKVKIFNNRIEWFDLDDNLHNEYGPAIVYLDCPDQQWLKHGVPHRIGGPSWISSYHITWHKDGKLHRLDGPAYTYEHQKFYYIEGVEFSKENFFDKVEELKYLESVK